MRLRSVALLAAAGLLLAGAPAHAAADASVPRRFASKSGANPQLRIVVKDRGIGRPAVDLGIAVTCGGFDLSGGFETKLKRGNRIAVRGDLDGPGTDTYEMKLELDGRLRKNRFSGQASVSGRAFDNGGETGTCDEQYEWSADRVTKVGLGDVVAEISLSDAGGGDVHLATGKDAIYAVTSDPATVKSIDPESNRVVFEVDVEGVADAIAVAASAVWLLDAEAGVVRRFDIATKTVDASVDVGARDANPPYPHANALAAVRGDVWAVAGSGRELVHIDGKTSDEIGRLDLKGSLDALASDGRALYANVVEVATDAQRTGDEPVHLVGLDPTGALPAIEPNSGTSSGIAVGDGVLWAFETLEVVEREAATLDGINRVQLSALGGVAADPGVWVRDPDDGLTVVDGTPQVMLAIKPLGREFTALTAGFGSVWVFDAVASDLVRFATQ
jgi:hypothetical protein